MSEIEEIYMDELHLAKEALKVKMFDDQSVAEYLEDKKSKEKYKKIYMAALEQYGEEAQITMVFEEMAELQKNLCKYLRKPHLKDIKADAYVVDDIAEEIADVEIMLEQMKLLFEIEDAVEKFKSIKVDRLKERLKL